MSKPLNHDEAIDALCGCAATVTTLSYQEAIEGYFALRGLPIPITPPEVGGELVERVARAICLAEGIVPKGVEVRWPEYRDAATAAIAALYTPEVVDGPSGVWSKAVYAAADKARNDALAIDPNDQMSALAVAVDAALACEASDAKGLVEALEKIAEGRSVLFSHSSHPKQPLRDKEAQRIARTALAQHRGVP